MAKKVKAGSKKKGGALSKGKRGPSRPKADDQNAQQQQNPYDRVNFVRPLWETLEEEERVKLLTVKLEDIRARALEYAEKAKNQDRKGGTTEINGQIFPADCNLVEVLDEGLARLKEQGTWKVWQWDASGKAYIDAEAFRREAEAEHISEELRQLLPREEGKPLEKPAEAALRDRMTNLLSQIHVQLQNAQDAWRRGQRNNNDQVETVVRDGNIDLVIAILEALQQEHHCLYQTILTPVTDFVCSLLPAKNRKSSRSELFFEDLEKLPPDEIARLYEWLTEKVDSLCAKLKPDPKEEEVEEEETVGDIDLFSLTPDATSLTVNPKWLHHLQERRLSEEGQPRKVKEGEDERRVGLVLEWVYGSIVSTAEKARDGAKRPLGSWDPSIKQAYENLCTALRDQREWEGRAKKAKELLKAMLETRKSLASTVESSEHTIPGTPAAREPNADTSYLPDDLIATVLTREELLTRAKLHILQYERMMADSQLRSLRAELMQVGASNGEGIKQAKGEPEFERLRRELDDVKNTPRGLEGTFRTAAEKERHRAQLADSLLEEQLEVQSAFREQGARLQGIYDKRQRTEIEIAKRDQEISQLRNWQRNVNQLIAKFQALMLSTTDDVEEGGQQAEKPHERGSDSVAKAASETETALEALRATFHRDFKKQLYSDVDDTAFFNRIKKELKHMDRRLEDGAVVLQHLEMFLINVACNDPGAAIGSLLVLPLLQERLDKEAMEFATHKASLAEEEILRMEENEKLEADAQKKLLKTRKSKDKLRREKEKRVSEQKAKEAAEQAETEEQEKRELEQLEEERQQHAAQVAQQHKEEEEVVEYQQQELPSDEHGYWRIRMETDDTSRAEVVHEVEASNDEFTSVGGNRRHRHERRSSWGGTRNSNHDKRTGGGVGSGSYAEGHPRRHNHQDSSGGRHRRIRSDADALAGNLGPNSVRDQSQMQSSGPRQHHHRSSRPGAATRAHGSALPDGSKSTSGSHNVWNHPDRRGHRSNQGRSNSQRSAAPVKGPQNAVTKSSMKASENSEKDVGASPGSMPPREKQQTPPVSTAPTAAAPIQKAVPLKKIAWVKGSIPASVIGKVDADSTGKESEKSGKVVESRSGSTVTDVSINSPATPDATEADAPSVQSDSDKSHNEPHRTGGKSGLSHIKTHPDARMKLPRDAPAPSGSPRRGIDTQSSGSAKFTGNGEQFFQMVQSVSAVEEETKEASEVGSNADDAEDESQASGLESGHESSPTAPVMMAPPVPPPFGMPMGGPMGPMAGYHPGGVPWMRPMGGMAPGMRPVYPFMAPPPSLVPPVVSGAPQSPPAASGAPPTSAPKDDGTPLANDPVRPHGPNAPMYFYPPHMMPHGTPMMQPFMPMMPGHWMGYPMGPHPPPFMSQGGQMGQKKFTLRPTAKEFIPPSMMNDAGSECASETVKEGGSVCNEEDCDAPSVMHAASPAIEQEA